MLSNTTGSIKYTPYLKSIIFEHCNIFCITAMTNNMYEHTPLSLTLTHSHPLSLSLSPSPSLLPSSSLPLSELQVDNPVKNWKLQNKYKPLVVNNV